MESSSSLYDDDDVSLLKRNRHGEKSSFDITAMIDLVFMMNIFFLVTMAEAVKYEINLPAARHVVPVDRENSVVISILEDPKGGAGRVYLGEANPATQGLDLDAQEREILLAVEEGVRSRKTTVLIKAEKNVPLRDVARIGALAASVPGIELKLAVIAKG